VSKSPSRAAARNASTTSHWALSRNLDKTLAKTNELRTKGTDALLAASWEAGVRRVVAQSGAAYARYERLGGPVKTEDDPLDPDPPATMRRSFAALDHLEQVVTEFGGIALRHGVFYGAANDGSIEPVCKRQFPIIGGGGGGIWSWIHLDDAAAATVLALEHDGPAILNVVGDEPAPVCEWPPVPAEALGAKPPRRLPTSFARLVAGEPVVVMSTEARGASNAKAKRELGWIPRHPSWRQGFADHYAKRVAATSEAGSPAPAAVAARATSR
jgi:nucleoside-diphosphate-sugar epimerase